MRNSAHRTAKQVRSLSASLHHREEPRQIGSHLVRRLLADDQPTTISLRQTMEILVLPIHKSSGLQEHPLRARPTISLRQAHGMFLIKTHLTQLEILISLPQGRTISNLQTQQCQSRLAHLPRAAQQHPLRAQSTISSRQPHGIFLIKTHLTQLRLTLDEISLPQGQPISNLETRLRQTRPPRVPRTTTMSFLRENPLSPSKALLAPTHPKPFLAFSPLPPLLLTVAILEALTLSLSLPLELLNLLHVTARPSSRIRPPASPELKILTPLVTPSLKTDVD